MRELFSSKMEFTEATVKDIDEIQALLSDEVLKGTILYRNRDEIARNIRSYTLVKRDEKLIGLVALHIHTAELGEVRSLFVHKDFRREGVANQLINLVISEGKALNLKSVLTLTYRDSLFRRIGFVEIEKRELPDSKIWADCMDCKDFPVCGEIALLKEL